MNALLSNTRAEGTSTGQQIVSDVLFYGAGMDATLSTIWVPFGDADTSNQVAAKVLAGVDAESQRLGLGTATRVFGTQMAKYR